MSKSNKNLISLDKYIDQALYDKNTGYYMKKNPFGIKGDFITSPNVSILFSEMIIIWIMSFWKDLGKPKKFNIVELGSGNGNLIMQMAKTSYKFKNFYNACNFYSYEKSPRLISIQKKKMKNCKVKWIKKLINIEKSCTIFIANEFFDALPIKQFIKKNNQWYEKYIENKKEKRIIVYKKKDIKKYEKLIGINLSNNNKFIEFAPKTLEILKELSKIINSYNGGLLIIDYGYTEEKMKNTIQAIKNHKKVNFLDFFGEADITYNLNFNLIKKFISKLKLSINGLTTQEKFLINLGILYRAEIISKNLPFSKKADIYYRLKRLIGKNEMGNLFKVMFITKKNTKFKLGF